MRLLRYELGSFNNDRITLVEVSNANIPPYAILSHTWGFPEDEITSEDISEGTNQHKPGWDKIRFCGSKVTPQLQHFWIDTCCLDRTNNVELQQAINAMFSYYQNAEICYAYLSDVSEQEQMYPVGPERTDYMPDYANWHMSKWFYRGWTLQELVAPKAVHFYAPDGTYLGDRESQAVRICQTTGIDGRVLRGRAVGKFSIKERCRWAQNRSTAREEDVAYCLLGILGVQMPIAYGEGRECALFRLQERLKEGREARHRIVTPVARSIWKVVYGPPDSKPVSKSTLRTLSATWLWVSPEVIQLISSSSLATAARSH